MFIYYIIIYFCDIKFLILLTYLYYTLIFDYDNKRKMTAAHNKCILYTYILYLYNSYFNKFMLCVSLNTCMIK